MNSPPPSQYPVSHILIPIISPSAPNQIIGVKLCISRVIPTQTSLSRYTKGLGPVKISTSMISYPHLGLGTTRDSNGDFLKDVEWIVVDKTNKKKKKEKMEGA